MARLAYIAIGVTLATVFMMFWIPHVERAAWGRCVQMADSSSLEPIIHNSKRIAVQLEMFD